MAEWSKASGCYPDGFRPRRFESCRHRILFFSFVQFCLHLQLANATHVLFLDTQHGTSDDIYIHFVLIELQCFVANRD